jgi:hypothetical protein
MENYKEQFEDLPDEAEAKAGLESKLKNDFSFDLKGLLQPPNPVPQAVDKKILNLAQKQFAKKRYRRILQWLVPTAAAAVFLLALILTPQLTTSILDDLQRPSIRKVKIEQIAKREDIDRSGTVNILDAMKLDMQIKNAAAGPEYDFNKDGIVNKKDVDMVAFNAVRINKGVL